MSRAVVVVVLALIGVAAWLAVRSPGDAADDPTSVAGGSDSSTEDAPLAVPPRTRTSRVEATADVASASAAAAEPEPPAIHALRGTVCAWDGQPIARAIVHAAPLPLLPRAPDPRKARDATCDAGGAFELPPLPAGDWTLTIDADGAVGVFGATVSVPDVASVDLVLPRGGVIEGTVVDAETRARLAGARVRLLSYRDRIAEVTTSPEGRFRMAYFGRPASPEFRMTAPGYEREIESDALDSSLLGRQEVVLLARRGIVVRGIVTSPDGRVAGASVVVAANSFIDDDEDDYWRTATDANGAFAVEGYPRDEGSCNVMVTAPGLLLEQQPDPDLESSEGLRGPDVYVDLEELAGAPAEIRMRPRVALGRCTVAGRVVGPNPDPDAEDALPVAGVVVRCTQPGSAVSATSGADGSYALEVLADGTERGVELVAERNGVRAGSVDAGVVAGRRVEADDLLLADELPPQRLRGRVTANDAPVAGARVVVYGFKWEAVLRCWVGPQPPPSAVVVRTDADGTFDVEITYGDSIDVAVAVDGFAVWRQMLDREKVAEPCDVRLERPSVLAGRVVRTGSTRGVGGVRVALARSHANDFEETPAVEAAYEERVVAVTAADGSFRIASVDLARDTLRLSAPGLASAEWEHDADDESLDAANVVVEMTPELALRGRVEFADGKPAAGVRLAVSGPDDRLSTWWTENPPAADDPLNDPSETIATAEDGTFRLDRLPAGARVYAFGGTPPVRRVFFDAGGTDERRIVVAPGRSIRGRVSRSDGRAAANVVVRARPEGDDAGVAVAGLTDRDGSFEIDGLGDGPHEMTCGADGAFRWNRRGVIPGEGLVLVTLDEGLAIAGVLRAADGEALHTVEFVVEAVDAKPPAGERKGRCDYDGQFRVATLTPGRWRIRFAESVRIPPTEVTAGDASIVLTASPAPDDDGR